MEGDLQDFVFSQFYTSSGDADGTSPQLLSAQRIASPAPDPMGMFADSSSSSSSKTGGGGGADRPRTPMHLASFLAAHRSTTPQLMRSLGLNVADTASASASGGGAEAADDADKGDERSVLEEHLRSRPSTPKANTPKLSGIVALPGGGSGSDPPHLIVDAQESPMSDGNCSGDRRKAFNYEKPKDDKDEDQATVTQSGDSRASTPLRRRSPSPNINGADSTSEPMTTQGKPSERSSTLAIASLTHKTPLRSRAKSGTSSASDPALHRTPITASFLSPLFKTPRTTSPFHSQSDTAKKRRAQLIDACESFSAKREPLANESPMAGGARSALFIPPRTPELGGSALLNESPSRSAEEQKTGSRGAVKIESSPKEESFASELDRADTDKSDTTTTKREDGDKSGGENGDVAPMDTSAEPHASANGDSLPPTPSKPSQSQSHNSSAPRDGSLMVKAEPTSPQESAHREATSQNDRQSSADAPAPAPTPSSTSPSRTSSASPMNIKRETAASFSNNSSSGNFSGSLSAALATGDRRSASPLSRSSSAASASSIALPPLLAPLKSATPPAASLPIPSSYSAPASYFQSGYIHPLAAAPPSSPPFDPPALAASMAPAGSSSVGARGGVAGGNASSQMDPHTARLHEIAQTKFYRPHQGVGKLSTTDGRSLWDTAKPFRDLSFRFHGSLAAQPIARHSNARKIFHHEDIHAQFTVMFAHADFEPSCDVKVTRVLKGTTRKREDKPLKCKRIETCILPNVGRIYVWRYSLLDFNTSQSEAHSQHMRSMSPRASNNPSKEAKEFYNLTKSEQQYQLTISISKGVRGGREGGDVSPLPPPRLLRHEEVRFDVVSYKDRESATQSATWAQQFGVPPMSHLSMSQAYEKFSQRRLLMDRLDHIKQSSAHAAAMAHQRRSAADLSSLLAAGGSPMVAGAHPHSQGGGIFPSHLQSPFVPPPTRASMSGVTSPHTAMRNSFHDHPLHSESPLAALTGGGGSGHGQQYSAAAAAAASARNAFNPYGAGAMSAFPHMHTPAAYPSPHAHAHHPHAHAGSAAASSYYFPYSAATYGAMTGGGHSSAAHGSSVSPLPTPASTPAAHSTSKSPLPMPLSFSTGAGGSTSSSVALPPPLSVPALKISSDRSRMRDAIFTPKSEHQGRGKGRTPRAVPSVSSPRVRKHRSFSDCGASNGRSDASTPRGVDASEEDVPVCQSPTKKRRSVAPTPSSDSHMMSHDEESSGSRLVDPAMHRTASPLVALSPRASNASSPSPSMFDFSAAHRRGEDERLFRQREGAAFRWVSKVTGRRVETLADLQSGETLIALIELIRGSDVQSRADPSTSWGQRINVAGYLDACRGYGLGENGQFVPDDLFSGNSLPVVSHLFKLCHRAKRNGWCGPVIAGDVDDDMNADDRASSMTGASAARLHRQRSVSTAVTGLGDYSDMHGAPAMHRLDRSLSLNDMHSTRSHPASALFPPPSAGTGTGIGRYHQHHHQAVHPIAAALGGGHHAASSRPVKIDPARCNHAASMTRNFCSLCGAVNTFAM